MSLDAVTRVHKVKLFIFRDTNACDLTPSLFVNKISGAEGLCFGKKKSLAPTSPPHPLDYAYFRSD